jgi:branched-chain amino acid transport system permease protein
MQTLILGILLGGVYGLMATGLTLLYGVMQVVNLAHAAFMVLAAYIAFELYRGIGLDPFLSIAITVPALFVLGVVAYWVFFERISGSPRFSEMTVLLTFGLAIAVEGGLGAGFTGIYHSSNPSYATGTFHLGDAIVPQGQLYAFVASLVLLGLLGAFLFATRPGYALRATMQNRSAAQIIGVNVQRISALAFGLGFALAGAAGSLMSYLFSFYPAVHWQFIALLLSLIVVGGLGSLGGALGAAVLLSIVAAFMTDWLGPVWSYLTFYLALFAVLLVRPQGLFGRAAAL